MSEQVKTKKETIKQYKEFFIVLYREPTKNELLSLGVLDYAYIKHDLDYFEEGHEKAGELKKEHWHLYIKLRIKKTIAGVGKAFNYTKEQSSLLVESTNGKCGAVRYMTHIDYVEKQPYSLDNIVSNFDISKYFELNISTDDFVIRIITAIDNGEITTFRNLVQYALNIGCLELVMKNSYFYGQLLKN